MATYKTDFSEYTTDQQPSDWTERWHTGSAAALIKEEAGAEGGKYLRIDQPGNERYALSWDDVGDVADVEVLAKVRCSSAADNIMRVYIRGSGDSSSEQAYCIDFKDDQIDFVKYVSGAHSIIDSFDPIHIHADLWYMVRIRAEGTAIKAKIWVADCFEPSEWAFEVTDSDIASGWVGVGGYRDNIDSEYDWFSVVTGGGTVTDDLAIDTPSSTCSSWDDDFTGDDDDAPDSDLWTETDADSCLSIQDNRLTFIASGANDKEAILTSKFELSGDFEVSLYFSWSIADKPGTSCHYGPRLRVRDATDTVWLAIDRWLCSSPGYATRGSSTPQTQLNRGDLGGRLKITRSGSVIKGFYWNSVDEQWEWNGSTAGFTFDETTEDDLTVVIYYKQESNYQIKASVDYFRVVDGGCPTTSPPTTLAPTTAAPTTLAPTSVAPTTLAPTTLAPTTIAPTTLAATTISPTTLAPTTLAPTTIAPTTTAPTTLEPTTLAPTTLEPTTAAPTTLEPTTTAPTTTAPTTLEPTTSAPTTLEPTTLPPTTLAPTTLAPTTLAPTTLAPTTVAPTTLEPTTVAPTTLVPTTLAPTTLAPTTLAVTTLAPTTVVVTTVAPTSLAPTTLAATTIAPTTLASTTLAPSTLAPTTMLPTTVAPTTVSPTTLAPTTLLPTTLAPTSLAPTTLAATTLAPTTIEPTTLAPTTISPTTIVPTTIAPTTLAPTTLEPTTLAPTTLAPTTLAPTTLAPTTLAPTTLAPTTVAPTTLAPTTLEPTTVAPTTISPTTLAPTTVAPTTLGPTTLAPTTVSLTTLAPTTLLPTTLAPTTVGPTTIPPTSLPPTTDIPEAICVKACNSLITDEIICYSPINEELVCNGYLC